MHYRLIVLVLAVILGVAANARAEDKPEQVAQAVAEQWLQLVDAGKFEESWKGAASYFRDAISSAQWKSSLNAVRKPLGDLVSRRFREAKFTKSLPGAPDGEYVVLQFDTSFSNKSHAVETVTPMLQKDGRWRVSGYFIK